MVVVIQQTAHTRPAANRPAATGSPERLNQFVADALMVSLTVVVRHEVRNRAAKVALTGVGARIVRPERSGDWESLDLLCAATTLKG